MRKNFSLPMALLSIMMLVGMSQAAAPNLSFIYGAPEVAVDTAIRSTAGFDTLSGVDSSTLFTKALIGINSAWNYILVRDALTGGGTDSLKLQVMLDALDGSGNLLYRTVCDSFTTAAGEAVLLPVGTSSFGTKYRVKIVGYTDNGGQVILNRFFLYKARITSKSLSPAR